MTKNTFLLMLTSLLCLLFPLKTTGEQKNYREDYFEQLKMMAEIKSLLRSSMSNYFDPASFMLDLQIDLIEANPNIHYLPDMDENVVIAELPGLPFIRIPRFSATETDISFAEETKHNVTRVMERIRLNIYADNFYGSDDLDFMRMLAAIVLQSNADAGDEINIFQIALPRVSLLERRLEHPDEPGYPSPAEIALEQSRVDQHLASPEENTEAIAPLSMIWLGAIIVTAMLLSVLSAFYLLKRYKSKKEEKLLSYSVDNEIRAASDRVRGGIAHDETLIKTTSENNGNGNIQKDHLFVTTCFLQRTNDLALLFENWMNRNNLEGANKIARIINMLDSRYLKLFEGLVSECSYSSIEEAMQDPDNKCIDIDSKLLSKSAADLRRFLYSDASKGISTLHFLSHMDNNSLIDLCNSLLPAELSILLDKLSDEQLAKVFDAIGPDSSASVMTLNARKKHIDFKELNRLAEKWFAYFLDHKTDKEFNTMKLGRLVGLLEKQCIEKQEQFLSSIQGHDPALHQTIYDSMLTWKKLKEVDPQTLKTAFARTDSRTLALALADTENAIKEKILSLRPKREQLLIIDMMSEAASATSETKEKAKQTMLKAVRKHIQTNMEHLTSINQIIA